MSISRRFIKTSEHPHPLAVFVRWSIGFRDWPVEQSRHWCRLASRLVQVDSSHWGSSQVVRHSSGHHQECIWRRRPLRIARMRKEVDSTRKHPGKSSLTVHVSFDTTRSNTIDSNISRAKIVGQTSHHPLDSRFRSAVDAMTRDALPVRMQRMSSSDGERRPYPLCGKGRHENKTPIIAQVFVGLLRHEKLGFDIDVENLEHRTWLRKTHYRRYFPSLRSFLSEF